MNIHIADIYYYNNYNFNYIYIYRIYDDMSSAGSRLFRLELGSDWYLRTKARLLPRAASLS